MPPAKMTRVGLAAQPGVPCVSPYGPSMRTTISPCFPSLHQVFACTQANPILAPSHQPIKLPSVTAALPFPALIACQNKLENEKKGLRTGF